MRSFEGIYLEIMQIKFPTISIFDSSEQSSPELFPLPRIAICSACLTRSACDSGCCASASVSARVGLAAGAEWKCTFSLPSSFPRCFPRTHPFRDYRGTRAHVSGPGRSYIFLFSVFSLVAQFFTLAKMSALGRTRGGGAGGVDAPFLTLSYFPSPSLSFGFPST